MATSLTLALAGLGRCTELPLAALWAGRGCVRRAACKWCRTYWPGWRLQVVTSAWQSARAVVLGRNPQLLSAVRIGEMCSGSLKEKEAWQCGTCGQHVVCSEPWLLAMLYTASVGGKRSRWWRDGDPCVSGEQMCEPSRLRWLSCCWGMMKPRLVSAYREFATICYLCITWLFGSEGEITFFFPLLFLT